MITTCTLWVCSKCGVVSHVDGGVPLSAITHGICSVASQGSGSYQHTIKPILVVVPYG